MGIRTIVIAYDKKTVDVLVGKLKAVDEEVIVNGFTEEKAIIRNIKQSKVDVVVVDIGSDFKRSIAFAKRLKKINSSVNIIFVADTTEFAFDAMVLHASGYLVKPITKKALLNEFKDLRKPILRCKEKRIHIHCFGNFEVYIDGKACKFKYVKTKELLAYLVDRRGSNCTNGELLGALWEDSEVTYSLENYLRNLISDLKAVFRESGLSDFIIKQRGQIRINTEMANCDYYNYVSGLCGSKIDFTGEYMTQYSWAESTLAGIEAMIGG